MNFQERYVSESKGQNRNGKHRKKTQSTDKRQNREIDGEILVSSAYETDNLNLREHSPSYNPTGGTGIGQFDEISLSMKNPSI